MGQLRFALRMLGFDPWHGATTLREAARYFSDLRRFRALMTRSPHPVPIVPHPQLHDRTVEAGTARGAYFHQDLLVAQMIHERGPRRHVDVGSRVDGFVAHVAAFRPIEVFDIRPLESAARNIRFQQLDLLQTLPADMIECCDSLSCLHALEHFGLGRYGDPIDLEGHVAALANLKAMLEVGGILYLAVPIGPERIEFNAHRVFLPSRIRQLAEPDLTLKGFSIVDDAGDLHRDLELGLVEGDNAFGCRLGLGIFVFEKAGAALPADGG